MQIARALSSASSCSTCSAHIKKKSQIEKREHDNQSPHCADGEEGGAMRHNFLKAWSEFRPRKKRFAPPPPLNSPQTPSRPLGLPTPSSHPGGPPPPGFSVKTGTPPPLLAPRTPPSPPPSRKKYPKGPPRKVVTYTHAPQFWVHLRSVSGERIFYHY